MGVLLTGNVLETGDVVWWTGNAWSADVTAAALLERAAAEPLLADVRAAERIVDAELVDARADGLPEHVRERIRAAGPTVRPDLMQRALP